MKRIVATGLGIASALGCSPDAFWSELIAGKSGVAPITSFDVSGASTRIGAEITALRLEDHFPPKMVRRLSRISLFAIYAAQQAVQHACLQPEHLARTGVILGASQGGFVDSEQYFRDFYLERRTSPFGIVKPMNSAPASHVSIECGTHGPVLTVDTACSSANHAIGLATMLIRQGVIDHAIAGGVDTVFSEAVFRSWCALTAMSKRNDTPGQACKPFSRNRDGTVLGEGAGIVVLESEESAQQRGAPILAEVIGYGTSGDAFHITQSTADGPASAIQCALDDAGVTPQQVDYINAHATGTPANDSAETLAIKQVFGERAYEIPVSGIKAAVGHTLAASAGIEFVTCVKAINEGIVPPTLNYDDPDPDCDLDYVIEGARRMDVDVCMSNSFGFGGSNAVLVLRRYRNGHG